MDAATPERLVGREPELAAIEEFLARAGPAGLALDGDPSAPEGTLRLLLDLVGSMSDREAS